MPVRFSICILTHNRLAEVQRCFESLRPALEREDVECLVLDNASSDGAREYVDSFTAETGLFLYCIFLDQNVGVAGGRRRLLDRATGERIVFLDSDTTILDQGWLDDLDRALDAENVGLVGPGGSFMLPDWSNFTAAIPGHECDVVAGYCQMFKRDVLKAGASLDLAYGQFWTEDSDFCMQIRAAGYDIWCAPTGVMHEPGHSGDGATDEQLQRNLVLFRGKWQGKGLVRCEGGY